ncbi:MAG: hypothetical protein ACREMW_10100 [Gemmatimonadales bacterium]
MLCGILLAGGLGAQAEGSVVASLSGSTRSAGLGGAGVALIGDAGAMFANPAGIATIHRLALEASYEPYLAGTRYSTAALALRTGRIAWGFGAQALDYGSEPIIVPDPATGGRRGMLTGGTFRATDVLAMSAVVYRRGFIAAGAAAKYARQQIGAWSADAWGGDVGLAIAVFDILAFGVSVQNLGGRFGGGTDARLPRRTRAGFTMNYVDPAGTYRLLTTIEGQWPAGAPALLVTGVEGGVVTSGVGLVGRVGYGTQSPTSAASRWTAGGGLELRRLHLDYAYQSFALLGGGTHRVGIRWAP